MSDLNTLYEVTVWLSVVGVSARLPVLPQDMALIPRQKVYSSSIDSTVFEHDVVDDTG